MDTLTKKLPAGTQKGITSEDRRRDEESRRFLQDVYFASNNQRGRVKVNIAKVDNKYLVMKLAKGTPTKGSVSRPDPRKLKLARAVATGEPLLVRKGKLTAPNTTNRGVVVHTESNGAGDYSDSSIHATYQEGLKKPL